MLKTSAKQYNCQRKLNLNKKNGGAVSSRRIEKLRGTEREREREKWERKEKALLRKENKVEFLDRILHHWQNKQIFQCGTFCVVLQREKQTKESKKERQK